VSELLELAKLEAHETQIQCEPFPLAELVQDVVQKFHLAAQEKHLELQTTFAEELPFVCGDIGLIERVLDNLIQNALRYTSPGGTITIALKQVETAITVQVIDTGIGIPSEELSAIFERFYRARQTRRAVADGAGLGLAITRHIVELHGGSITVDSIPNGGTTFIFSLPIYDP
jgi:signal transduction histidine kinase